MTEKTKEFEEFMEAFGRLIKEATEFLEKHSPGFKEQRRMKLH